MSRKERIEAVLHAELNPTYIEVKDESMHHHVPEDAQTHFKVIIVSDAFKGLTSVGRHRLINHLVKEEFDKGLHALSLAVFTPQEWDTKNKEVLKSPPCKDGFNK